MVDLMNCSLSMEEIVKKLSLSKKNIENKNFWESKIVSLRLILSNSVPYIKKLLFDFKDLTL